MVRAGTDPLVSGRSAVRIRSPAPSTSDMRKRDLADLGAPSARCAQRLSSFLLLLTHTFVCEASRRALAGFSLDNEDNGACQLDGFGEFCAHPRVRVAERLSRRASAILDRVEWLAGDVVAAPAGAIWAQDAGGSE